MSGGDPLGGLGSSSGDAQSGQQQGPQRDRPKLQGPRLKLDRLSGGTPTAWILVFVLGAFFLAQCAAGDWDPYDPLVLFRMGALHWVAVLDGDLWRLGSASFLHIGVAHFLLNASALWVFMRPIELNYGAASALGIYSISVLAGSIASALWAWHSRNPYLFSAGASGGIFGLFGAQFSFWLRVRKHLPPEASSASLRALLVDLVFSAVFAWQAAANGLALDNAAHLGGLSAGVFFGLVAPIGVLGRRIWSIPAQALLVLATFAIFSMEGAAVARAVHPHNRVLRGDGVAADAPWMLVPAIDGVAIGPGGIGMEARIYRSSVPLALDEPGDAMRLGDRTWVRVRSSGLDEGEERLMFSSREGGGSVRVEVLCATATCNHGLADDTAIQLARTFRTTK